MGREPAGASEPAASLQGKGYRMRNAADLDPLLDQVGDARYVLLGEASHGTAEFYTWRATLRRRLILEKGFSFIAVEGDWPDCYRLNQFVQGRPASGGSAREVLRVFERWPTWMWANEEVVVLAEWLRQHNKGRPEHRRVGFYGLDVYSLGDSLRRVADYLQHRPSAEVAARRAFECFEPYGSSAEEYARATRWVDASCEDEVVALLTEVRRTASLPGMEREASFALLLLSRLEAIPGLSQRRGHRAVGVVYHPEAEIGNYVPTVLPRRYDALLYLVATQALHPLHDVPARSQADVPETYPSGV